MESCMSRLTLAWKNRRFLWNYRRPLWKAYKHRKGLLFAAGAGLGFLSARAMDRAWGK
jgi:hypothetical protein